MKSRLVVYEKGTRADMEERYGKEDTMFLNISRRDMSEIQGMRFSTIIVEEDITTTKSEVMKIKHSL